MANRLSFTTLDVFTESRFAGNQLAIVELPAAASLTQAQKQAVAREFNYSETVFLHEDAGPGMGRRAEIFTIYEEIPFAGTMHLSFLVFNRWWRTARVAPFSTLFSNLDVHFQVIQPLALFVTLV